MFAWESGVSGWVFGPFHDFEFCWVSYSGFRVWGVKSFRVVESEGFGFGVQGREFKRFEVEE